MPTTKIIQITDLSLDLSNYRTVKQPDEANALHAMVAISPDYFWALTESLLDSGYLPTENVLVLEGVPGPATLVVKEGNRRVAALKLVFGILPAGPLAMPSNIATRISNLTPEWRAANFAVPCAVYPASEAGTVDRIVTLAHGKGEKAGRDAWNAVARARHNRTRGGSEPGLDLLEKYLSHGTNLNSQQAERWSGAYPLSVLDEALKKLSAHFGASSGPELAKNYPSVQHPIKLDEILWAIGQELVRFPNLRKGLPKLIADYDLTIPSKPSGAGSTSGASNDNTSGGGAAVGASGNGGSVGVSGGGGAGASNGGASGTGVSATGTVGPTKKPVSRSMTDPRVVAQILRKFTPRGHNRQKVVALRDEALRLKIEETPMAFCFVLRSMFEISAKAYCEDHKGAGGPSATNSKGERKLVDILRDITDHLTTSKTDPNKKDPAMQKVLHGALTELANPNGILSVTSMNNLVHNPTFSITAPSISVLFGNVFPLLEEMNR